MDSPSREGLENNVLAGLLALPVLKSSHPTDGRTVIIQPQEPDYTPRNRDYSCGAASDFPYIGSRNSLFIPSTFRQQPDRRDTKTSVGKERSTKQSMQRNCLYQEEIGSSVESQRLRLETLNPRSIVRNKNPNQTTLGLTESSI